MDFYVLNLSFFVLINIVLAYLARIRRRAPFLQDQDQQQSEKIAEFPTEIVQATVSRFKYRFLIVYTLAVAADWLQGSFIYALYKTNLGLSETVVAALFTTGFLSAATSATFIGVLSDKALGGLSGTLLFTVFEAWMIAEHRRLFEYTPSFTDSSVLSNLFGLMSTINGITAICCGVVSQVLFQVTGSEKAPFVASIVCLMLAALVITRYWSENYGESNGASKEVREPDHTENGTNPWIPDIKVVALAFSLCIFEGSMYTWVYFWPQSMEAARATGGVNRTVGGVPFGLVFANFMCALLIGSWLSLSVAACSLLISVNTSKEAFRFWSFCLFEFCVGLYFPSMGYLKGEFIQNAHRARTYGFMRIPLNLFIIALLGTISEGEVNSGGRFIGCGALLLISLAVLHRSISARPAMEHTEVNYQTD